MAEGCVTGSRIKLISKAHIRYEGKLSKVDPVANTVTLDEVRMFGTEGRETNGQQQIPGAPDKVYAQIVFKGSDIAQLSVVKQPLPDPAVVSYSSEPQHAAKTHVTAMQPSHDNTPRVAQMFDRFASEQRPHNNNYSYNGGISHGKGFDGGKRGHDGGYNGRGSFGGGYGGDLGKGGGGGGGGGGFKGGKRGYGGGHHHGGGKGRGGGGYGKGTRGGMKGGRDSGHTGMNFKLTNDEQANDNRQKLGDDFNFDEVAATSAKLSADKVPEAEDAKPSYNKSSSFFDTLNQNNDGRMSHKERQKHHDEDVATFGRDAVVGVERSFHRNRRQGGGRGRW